MRRVYLTLTTILIAAAAIAQQNPPASASAQTFTLEQCIQYALENSTNVKNATIDERIADAKVKETRGIGLPQVDASVGLQHNQKLPRFFGRYVAPDPNDPSAFSLVPPQDGLETGDIVAGQNFFQLKSSGNAGLNINQILFNGSYLVGLKAASAYRELSVKSTQQTKEQAVQQVMKAYYGVLINKDRIQLFDNNIARVESLLKTTQALNTNGFAESIDVDRLQVTLNNLRSEREKFNNLQELSMLLLKFQMNYPMNDPINVVGDISALQVDENVLQQYSADWDYAKRIDYSILETNRKLQTLDLKNKYAEGLPSLSAFANLGYSTQSNNISGIFKTETQGDIDWAQGYGPDKWYSFSSFGINLNIPIFSGLQRNFKVQQSKLALQKIENSTQSLKSAIDLEVKQSAIGYLNAVTSLKSQKENMKLAENVARVTRIKYEQGVGSNIEVIDAESSLKESQINYYNALYDALVAKVDLDKAYGKLNPQTSQENK
jgi:outer membrane protein